VPFTPAAAGSGIPFSNDELKLIASGINAGAKFDLNVVPFDELPAAVKDEAAKQGYKSKNVAAPFHNDVGHLHSITMKGRGCAVSWVAASMRMARF